MSGGSSKGSTTVKKGGTAIGDRSAINLIEGANVTLTVADDSANGEIDVTIAATSGGGAATVLDEGISQGTATSFDFVGGGVTAAVSGSVATVTIPSPTVSDGSITLAKLANLDQDKFIIRTTASTGVPETATCTAAGRALLDDVDAAAMRTTLGLAIGTNVQAYDAELAAIAGLTSAADKGIQFTGAGTAATFDLTAAGKALLDDADAAAQRTTLGLGTAATAASGDFQAADSELSAIAGLTSAADRLPYFTGSGTAALATFTAAGRALVDDADAAAQLVTLGAIGGSTGSTDNVLVRADGTGGKTLQTTGITISDTNGISGHISTQNVQSGTTYTVASTDAGKHLIFTSGSAVTVTIPDSLLVGFQCSWEQRGAGKVSFNGSAVTAATLNCRSSGHVASAGQYGVGGISIYTGSGSGAVATLYGDTGT